MGYQKIRNLYQAKDILLFRECYASEKIHGTSAHISWRSDKKPYLTFFSGGEKHTNFVELFDRENLLTQFAKLGRLQVVVYGEAYGGKCQGMKDTYGPDLKFVAFEVRMDDTWLCVPDAEEVVNSLGLEFVHYKLIPTTLEAIDVERDADSVQAIRNGMGSGKKKEGVVLRPLIELTKNNGERVIAKHKRDDFRETKTPRNVSAERLEKLTKADEIAKEWVTEMRLTHVLDKVLQGDQEISIEKIGPTIKEMVADIEVEAENEIEMSKEARRSISTKTARMFKARLRIK